MITLRQIQFALAVARHKHFKRAAEECNVSQSALSLGVAELEKILGVIIFERSNKQVVTTPIGEELLARAQQIFLDAQQLMERAYAGQGELNYSMSIGFIPTIAPYLLPSLFPILKEKHPNFSLNIREDGSERLIQAVQNGILDAAVIALPFETNGLHTMEFGSEKFYLLIHKSHNHIANKKEIEIKDLKDIPLFLTEGQCLKNHIIELCRLESNNRDTLRFASLNTLIQMALNNMGATLIPQMALPYLSEHSDVCAIPVNHPGPHRRLAIVTRQNYPRLDELNHLKNIFITTLDKIHNSVNN